MQQQTDPNELASHIQGSPHWRVVIRPTRFVAERIKTLSECWQLVESSRVSLRGWDYPHIAHQNQGRRLDYVHSWVDFGRHREFWRFYQSAQFVHLFSFTEDEIREKAEEIARAEIYEMSEDFSPSGYLDVISTLWTITEIFEFAARLAEKEVLNTSASITIQMVGVKDRVLFMWDQGRAFWRMYTAQEETLGKEWRVEIAELLSQSSALALDAAEWFFERFQWSEVPRNILADDQKRLLERKF